MKKPKEISEKKKGNHRLCSTCGNFLKKEDKKNCGRCKELKRLRDDLKHQKGIVDYYKEQSLKCANKNKELHAEISTLKTKKQYRCWLHIAAKNWDLTPEYLQKIIEAIAPVASVFDIEYGTYNRK